MEMTYRERDLFIPANGESVTASRNLLKAIQQKNPKRLTEWRFEVHDSAPESKSATSE
jgi:hypothetical protein